MSVPMHGARPRLLKGVLQIIAAILSTVALVGTIGAAEETTGLPDVQGPSLTWNMSLWGKPRAGSAMMESLSEEIAVRTNGRWGIVLHYGESLSKARENLDGLAIGAFEAAMICNYYHPRKNPGLMALSLPFLPISGDWNVNRRVREAVHRHPVVIEQMARWNAMLYMPTIQPAYEFLGRGQPPLAMDDWQGMTVRAGGGLGKAMRLIGAVPSTSTATEVYTGVQTGTMDAASFPFTYAHIAYRIHEVADWFTSNFAPATADCPLVFSIAAHNALPPQYKALLVDVKDVIADAQIRAYEAADETNLPLLHSRLQEVSYTPEQLTEFRELAGEPIISAWIAEHQDDFDARSIIEAVRAAAGTSEQTSI